MGSEAEGGGVAVTGGGTLAIGDNSTIQSNHATGSTTSGSNGGVAWGGGVFSSGPNTVTIADSILRNNSAPGGNGANATGC